MLLPLSEQKALIALTFLPDVGPNDIVHVVSRYGTAIRGVEAISEWKASIRPDDVRRAMDRAEEDFWIAEQKQVCIIGLGDDRYPDLLSQTACPPPVLYVKGAFEQWELPSIAIVGSRHCTHYGLRVAHEFSRDLAKAGLVVVSGLARGIDSAAHTAVLEAGGLTLAILGHGLEWLYPKENRKLAERLIENGALISEFPMKMPPYPGNFPRRNRIISGLSRGVLVIEGRANSGSLITARMAAQEGREVMAIPGPVGAETSDAPHQLIQNGAMLVSSVSDVLSGLSIKKTFPSNGLVSSQVGEQKELSFSIPKHLLPVWELLNDVPIHRDQICQLLKIEASSLSSVLVELELMGHLKQVSGGLFIRAFSR